MNKDSLDYEAQKAKIKELTEAIDTHPYIVNEREQKRLKYLNTPVNKWGQTQAQIDEVDSIQYLIYDLTSAENLYNEEKIPHLKQVLNEWILGAPELDNTPIMDSATLRAISAAESRFRYATGRHDVIFDDLHLTREMYFEAVEKKKLKE